MSYINAERVDGKIYVWERIDPKTRTLKQYKTPLYFYVEDPKGNYVSLNKIRCSKLDFDTVEEYNYAKQQFERSRIKTFESDVSFEYKLLSEHYYDKPTPTLNVTFLDIEVDYNKEFGFANTKNPYAPINAIAIYHQWEKRTVVYSVPPKSWGTDPKKWDEMLDKSLLELSEIHFCKNEHDLLLRLIVEIEDSDALVGWNSNFFDIPYIGMRIEKVLGKSFLSKLSFDDAPKPRYRDVEIFGNVQTALDLGGRLNIDYIDLFKKFEAAMRPSYKLEAISNEVLPNLPKLKYDGSLADQYNKNYNFFLRYNIRDTECLRGFEEKLGYVALASQMFHSATGLYKNILGTIKLAEYSIMNYCHKELNVVCADSPKVDMMNTEQADGALVLEPQVGFHRWIGSIDINSLYPSAIRSLNISPETIVGQFVNEVSDFESIAVGGDRPHTLLYENGERETKTASEWRTYLKSKKWAISGFGTVFDQNKQGVIPAILAEWYSLRKKYQKLKEEADNSKNKDLSEYYDRLQYCYKIKLNSLYGALLNAHFKFHDKRMGESTTGTGRAILTFQCSKVNELLLGDYNLKGDAVAYGDTDSTYFKTYANDKDSAIEIADGIAELVNQAYPEFMRRAFLCSDGYDNIIKCGREIVASSGIFVTPKRYILQMVDKDGKATDKLKIMGLDTKKTILPKEVQDKLNGFIKRFLNEDSWDSISRDIVAFKDELKNVDVEKLGLPKGVKNVEKYSEEYRLYGDGARLPGHVRASILYNEMLKKHNDKESYPIVSDTKIRVYYLLNPIGKFKSIALPTDLEAIPQWFLDEIVIDKDAQIKRLVDNPLENILKAVNKEPPSKKTLLLNDLFELD